MPLTCAHSSKPDPPSTGVLLCISEMLSVNVRTLLPLPLDSLLNNLVNNLTCIDSNDYFQDTQQPLWHTARATVPPGEWSLIFRFVATGQWNTLTAGIDDVMVTSGACPDKRKLFI